MYIAPIKERIFSYASKKSDYDKMMVIKNNGNRQAVEVTKCNSTDSAALVALVLMANAEHVSAIDMNNSNNGVDHLAAAIPCCK